MSSMDLVTTLPRGPMTHADLAAIPDDGHRYELVDGTLLVSPAPAVRHQIVVRSLVVLLDRAAPEGTVVLPAPVDVVLGERTVLQPDVLVAHVADFTENALPVAPLLAIEVLSPSSRSVDLLLKYGRYAQAGVGHYWVVDPDEPSVTVFRLGVDGAYVEVARVCAGEVYGITDPFEVTISPADLVRP